MWGLGLGWGRGLGLGLGAGAWGWGLGLGYGLGLVPYQREHPDALVVVRHETEEAAGDLGEG